MGFLNFLSKPAEPLFRLPSGSFTVDREGRMLVATLPSSFPPELVQLIGRGVLDTFRDAQAAQLPLSRLSIRYGSLRISAREMRGGAIVFLSPQTPLSAARQH
jgi:hypothetical protein